MRARKVRQTELARRSAAPRPLKRARRASAHIPQLTPPHSSLQPPASALRTPASGLTLIELLIVIVILTTLVAAALPVLSPSTDDRRIREASRGVNTFITGAQAKAIALRRPYGIALKKLSQDTRNAADNGVCIEMFYVEQPPAFTGFSDTSSVRVALITPDIDPPAMRNNVRGFPIGSYFLHFITRGTIDNDNLPVGWFLPAGWDRERVPPSTLRPGDVVEVDGTNYELLWNPEIGDGGFPTIDEATGFFEATDILVGMPLNGARPARAVQFDREGRKIVMENDDSPGGFINIAVRVNGTTQSAAGPFWGDGVPFKIKRQPTPAGLTRTSAPPYQLPEGIAIDLRASGATVDPTELTPAGFFHRPEPFPNTNDAVDNDDAIVIMFSPEGAISRLSMNGARQNDFQNLTNNEPDDIFNGEVVSNIYLLVGPRENIPAPPATTAQDVTLDPNAMSNAADGQLAEAYATVNWLNPEARWVVIGAQSGRVVSTENAFVDLRSWSNGNHPYQSASPVQRRAWQIFGAREFAREMTQSGGG